MNLEGGERLVLKTLLALQGNSQDYILDSRLATGAKMDVQDVRDWLETWKGNRSSSEPGRLMGSAPTSPPRASWH